MAVAKVVPPSKSEPRKSFAGATAMYSAMVSPSARPRPSMEPAMKPDRPNGMTVMRMTSQRVAPRASADSICPGGVWTKISRAVAAMIGRIMMASTIPPVMTLRAVENGGEFW